MVVVGSLVEHGVSVLRFVAGFPVRRLSHWVLGAAKIGPLFWGGGRWGLGEG